MEALLKVLREKAFDKKPTVDELKTIAGLENVTAKERDAAWKAYQAEQAAEADAEQNTATATTTTTDNKSATEQNTGQDESPRYRVSVKRDGFRRCGRAWTGQTDVSLTDAEFSILNADPMFDVVEL